MMTFSPTTAGPSVPMLSIRVSHSLAIAARTMMTNRTAAALLTPDSIASAVSGRYDLTPMPMATGSAVRMNICAPRLRTSKSALAPSMKWSIERPTIIGRVMTVTTDTTAVYEIDRAVSPLASFVIMLEVTPPGQQASMISPTASSPSRPAPVATAKPMRGSTTI